MILYNKAIYGHPIDLAELCPSGAGQRPRFSRPRRVYVEARRTEVVLMSLLQGDIPDLPKA